MFAEAEPLALWPWIPNATIETWTFADRKENDAAAEAVLVPGGTGR